MRLSTAIVAFWLCGLSAALAQPESWLVLPIADGGDSAWMEPTVGQIGRELRRQGVGGWTSAQAIVAFEERGSSPPSKVTAKMVEAWQGRSQGALRLLAQGELGEALAILEEVQRQSLARLDALNRDPNGAQRVLDTCLYTVRALLETGDDEGARSQARDCIRIAPGIEPTPLMHPPPVSALLQEAAAPERDRTGSLLIESDPSDCEARVNGVLVGRTPFELTSLHAGEYRVQVECAPEAPGRVHPVRVSRGRSALFVVDRFERALRTEPLLHLRYAAPSTEAERARDAREIARALPASAVVLASRPAPESLELRLVSGLFDDAAFAKIAATASGPVTAQVADAVATLLAGECRDLTGEEAVTLDCATGEPAEVAAAEPGKDRAQRPPRGQFISGVTLASVGAASLLVGYSFGVARRYAGDDWLADPNSLSAQDKWLQQGTALIATSSAGSAMLVASMPLALPYRPKTPWWAWLSGGAGVALGAASVAIAATADAKPPQSCSLNGPDPGPCVNRGRQIDRAILLGVTAAPLLTMPLVYLLRKDEKKGQTRLAPSLSTGRSGALLGLTGRF